MWIQLTKKLAERLDGIDVSLRRVGDVLDLPPHEAVLLVAEGWARPVADCERDHRASKRSPDNSATGSVEVAESDDVEKPTPD